MRNIIRKIIFGTSFMVFAIGMTAFADGSGAVFQQEYLNEILKNSQTVSHQLGLVNTIDRLLDCSTDGRIEVAMIGLSEVPAYIVEAWERKIPEYQEVSISRYRMALNKNFPDSKTDFYRFRAVVPNGEVVETLIQNIQKDHKAAVVFTFVNGDPTGQFKKIQSVLEELLSVVEEGVIEVQNYDYSSVPQRIDNLWKGNAVKEVKGETVVAQLFTTNSAGGVARIWRLSAVNKASGFEQSILVCDNDLIYDNRNGQIISK
ncbi:MAG: hypothetical protein HQM10_22360 [Candidatus Riflebacteria bacterium]|nr:hypothetical protein [Candidatus Riflebacteria bacterium]